MHRIAIIGLGQIGSSIGMDLRGKFPGVELVGHDKEPETAGKARKKGAVDRVAYTLSGAVEDAAIIIIAVPVQAVREVMGNIVPHLSSGAIVTDTASTKARVLEWAEEILPESVDFVGGHPMAGVETAGIDGAQAGMFANATYAIIPLARTSESSVDTIVNLVKIMQARPLFLDPTEHDSLVASVSHLPIAISIALMRAASQSPSWREMARMAAGSFRDVSRLASGSPTMHADIFATNKETVLLWIEQFQQELDNLRRLIEQGGPALREALDAAYEARSDWLQGRVRLQSTDLAYGDLPRASEQMLSFFAGDKLIQARRRFDDADKRREKKNR